MDFSYLITLSKASFSSFDKILSFSIKFSNKFKSPVIFPYNPVCPGKIIFLPFLSGVKNSSSSFPPVIRDLF